MDPKAPPQLPSATLAVEYYNRITTLGLKPRRTIRVALWAGEEQGLRGSRAYVRRPS